MFGRPVLLIDHGLYIYPDQFDNLFAVLFFYVTSLCKFEFATRFAFMQV